jgi:hypothetical protein
LWRFLQQRTWQRLVIAGVALGVAQLLKFSCVMLVPIDVVLIVAWCAMQKQYHRVAFWKNLGTFAWQYMVLGLIGLALVWLVYIPATWGTPAHVEHEIIDSVITLDASWVPMLRDTLHAMEGQPILRALAHYGLGVYMVFQRVEGGNSTFILGYFDEKTIWWFFPVAWLLKTALPTLVLFFGGIITMVWNRRRIGKSFDSTWRAVLLFTPLVFY